VRDCALIAANILRAMVLWQAMAAPAITSCSAVRSTSAERLPMLRAGITRFSCPPPYGMFDEWIARCCRVARKPANTASCQHADICYSQLLWPDGNRMLAPATGVAFGLMPRRELWVGKASITIAITVLAMKYSCCAASPCFRAKQISRSTGRGESAQNQDAMRGGGAPME